MNKIYQKIKGIVENNNFLYVILINVKAYILYFLNKISNYQLEKIRFYKKVGYPINLKCPRSFNEKLVWKKIFDRNPLLSITADKVQVRSYIKEVLGEKKAKEILIPLLYVTDKPKTIPFKSLPSSFIIKPNHASGLKILVEDDTYYDKKKIIKMCKRWLKIPYGLDKLEWAYQSITRKIIIEKLLHNDNGNIPKDFKFYMFHGKCKLISVFFDRESNPSRSFFDEKWNFLSVKRLSFYQGAKIQKPKNYKKMLELAEILSKPYDYISIDLYNLNGKIYFGELTHYPGSGTVKFEPNAFDFVLGKHWKIESKYWEKQ